MIDKAQLIKVLILALIFVLTLASCSEIYNIDNDVVVDVIYPVDEDADNENVVFEPEETKNPQEPTILQNEISLAYEDSFVTPVRLEAIGDNIVTIFIYHGANLRIAVVDDQGNEMDALPVGYEVRWSVKDDGEAYVYFESNRGPAGINAFIAGIQETTEHFVITAQLYGPSVEESTSIVPIADAVVAFEITVEYKFYRKYIFHLDTEGLFSGIIMFYTGPGYVIGSTAPRTTNASERGGPMITFSPERRIAIREGISPFMDRHFDRESDILVYVFSGDEIWVSGRPGFLTQLPEFIGDNLRRDYVIHDSVTGFEWQVIGYDEKNNSSLWQWIIDNEIPLIIHDTEIQPSIIQEITGDLWDKFGIQAFVYGGDITLIGQSGILSQLPEFFEDDFYFDLIYDFGFELQYILYHEIPKSRLLRLLRGYMSI